METPFHVLGKWFLRIAGGTILFLVLAASAVIGLLQTDWGADQVRKIAVSQINQLVNGEVTVGGLNGNFLSYLRLSDIRVTQGGDPLAQADSVSVRFKLRPLLNQIVHLRSVDISNLDVSLRQSSDGSWNAARFVPQNTLADTAATAWTIQIDRAELDSSRVEARFYSPKRDSILEARDLSFLAKALVFGTRSPTGRLARLTTRVTAFDEAASYAVRTSAAVDEHQLTLDSLRIQSDATDIYAEATYPWPGTSAEPQQVRARLQVSPLALADVRPFYPALSRRDTLHATAELTGTTERLHLKTDARITGNGELTVDASFTPLSEQPLQYRGSAQLRDLDLAALTTGSTEITNIAADLQVDLSGSSLEELSGSTDMQIRELRWNEQPLRPTALTTQWDEGHIAFEGQTTLVRGYLTMTGEVSPFADIPTYTLNSRFGNLNLRRLPGMIEETDLTGRLAISGSRFEPREISLDGELALQSSSYGNIHLERARLNASVKEEVIELGTDVHLQAASLRGEVRIHAFDDPIKYRLRNGQFRNVNLAVLTNDTTMTSDLNGSFALTGEGSDLESLVMDGAVQLDGSSYLDRNIERADVSTRLNNGLLSFRGSLQSPGGHLEFDGRGQPTAQVPSLDQFAVSFEDLDLEYVMQDTTYSTWLNGRLTGRAAGTQPSTASLNTQLQLDSSRVNAQTINSIRASLALESRLAAVDLQAVLPDGSLALQGTARPFDEQPTYNVEEFRFTDLHLGNWLDNPALVTSLTGSGRLSGQGFDPATAVANALVQLDSSRINQLALRKGTLEMDLREQQLTADLEVAYPTGSTTAAATADLSDERVGFTAEGRIQNLRLFQLAGIDTLDGSLTMRFNVNGRGATWSNLSINGSVSSSDSYFDDVTLDSLYTRFSYGDSGIQADTFLVHSNVLDLTGAGHIARTETTEQSNFTFRGTIPALAPASALAGLENLEGSGRINGRIFSSPQSLRFDIETELVGLEYGGMHAAQLGARVLGEYDDNLVLDANLTLEAVSAATVVIDGITTDAQYTEDTIEFRTDWIIDQEREGRFRGRVDLVPGQERVVIDSLSMRMNDRHWQLLQQAVITYGDDYRISNFLLYSGNQQFAVDGVIAPTGRHDLITTIDAVEIAPFTDLFGYEGIGGELDGSIVFTGRANAPSLDGNLTLENFQVNGRSVGNFLLDVSYEDFLMDVNARLLHFSERELLVTGSLPINLSMNGAPPPSNRRIDLTARADSVSIGWVEPFVDPETAQDISGYLTANLQVGGTYNSPNTDGFFRLAGGSMRLPTLGTEYTDIHLDVVHQDTTVTIRRGSARSGDGRVQVDGVVHLTALDLGTFDLTINARDFRAANTPTYRLAVNSSMTMQGTTNRPVIRGRMTITQGTFNLGEEISSQDVEEITLSEEDIRTLEARFGVYVTERDTAQYDFYEAMVIDTLDVRISRNVWLRSASAPEMAIEFTGDLRVVKPAQGDLEAFGTIEVVPTRSYVSQFGRRFDIASGTLTFNGPIENPILDVEAEYNLRGRSGAVGQAQISLGLEGPLDDLRFDLGSEQGLTNVEIISYLILGRPPGQSVRGGADVGNVATAAAISQLTDLVEGLAATELGLDVIEIQHDQELGATLTAGAYLTSRLFTSVSWPISLAGQESPGSTTRRITVEYILSNWLILQLQREGDVLGLELLWEYSY